VCVCVCACVCVGPSGLTGQYYNNRFLLDTPIVTRIDPFLSFDWVSDLITPTAKDYVRYVYCIVLCMYVCVCVCVCVVCVCDVQFNN